MIVQVQDSVVPKPDYKFSADLCIAFPYELDDTQSLSAKDSLTE